MFKRPGSYIPACVFHRHCGVDIDAARPLMVAVNLSGSQIIRDGLAEKIRKVLEETGLDPRYLEITEGS